MYTIPTHTSNNNASVKLFTSPKTEEMDNIIAGKQWNNNLNLQIPTANLHVDTVGFDFSALTDLAYVNLNQILLLQKQISHLTTQESQCLMFFWWFATITP